MPKRYRFIFIIFVVSIVVTLVGYLLPETTEKVPVRVLLDNSAGKVVFNHKEHAETYGIDCATCHHESPNPEEKVLACTSCHGRTFDEEFIKSHEKEFTSTYECASCHHIQFEKATWNHDMHSEITDCQTCHHDTSIEPEPQNCAQCHISDSTAPADSNDPMPSLKNAVHLRCESCHAELYENGIQDCKSCHTDLPSSQKLKEDKDFVFNKEQASCASCHDNTTPQELIKSRMDAFHASCIGCHESMGTGPYTSEQCGQCHTK